MEFITMKNLIHTLHAFWILIALLNSTYLLSMMMFISFENNAREYLFVMDRMREFAQIEAKKAEEYNQKNPLMRLPNNALEQILSYCHTDKTDTQESLKNNIKNFIQLQATCKGFKNILTYETIGKFCKDYDLTVKNTTLKQLISNTDTFNRFPALILVCAGADANAKDSHHPSEKYILEYAIKRNDAELVAALLIHGADPNMKPYYACNPIFFYAQTIEIAPLLTDNGANIHHENSDGNVLNIITRDSNLPSTLIELYLSYKVSVRHLDYHHGDCILHSLFYDRMKISPYIKNVSNFLKKSELLLDAVPDMINTLDKWGRTPIDTAQGFIRACKHKETITALEQVITLFKERGGKTAQELQEEKNCFICMDTDANTLDIPCNNPHPARMCLTCYNQLLATTDSCPFCRKSLKI